MRRLVMEVEVITVGHESSVMQTIWEHEMIGDICSWKELDEAAWAAHEGRQPSQRESKKRNREGGTGKGVLQGVDEVVSADDKDENEVTDRLGRISGSPAPLPLAICGAMLHRSTMRCAGAAAARKDHGRHST